MNKHFLFLILLSLAFTSLPAQESGADNHNVFINKDKTRLGSTDELTLADGPEILIADDELDFSNVYLGTDSTLRVRIYNIGNDTLRIEKALTTKSVFTLSDSALKIAPSKNDTIFVTFEPDSPKTYLDSLVIFNNDTTNNGAKSRIAIPLMGEGRGPAIYLESSQLDFGSIPLGSDTVQNISIQNSGNEILEIKNLHLTGADSVSYIFTDEKPLIPFVIKPDSIINIPVRFRPLKPRENSARLIISCNDPFNGEVIAELNGYAQTASFDLPQTYLDFKRIPVSTESVEKIMIKNKGEAKLIVYFDSLQITGAGADAFAIVDVADDIEIIPGDSALLPVRFSAGQLGPVEADLKISGNDPDNPNHTIMLSGIGYDDRPAQIALDTLNSSTEFVKGQSAQLSFAVTCEAAVDSVVLHFRRGGKTVFNSISLAFQDGADLWAGQISSEYITERGLQYFVRAYHSWNITDMPHNGSSKPQCISVSVPRLQFDEITRKAKYQMISVPIVTEGQTLTNLFSDNLGAYNNTEYRFYDCLNGTDYTEITKMDISLPPGKALWLITKDQTNLDVADGRSVETSDNYEIQLHSGWNMIANPFAFPVSWSDVSGTPNLRYYDGDWHFAETLEPFKGYALHVDQDTIISIPPVETSAALQIPKEYSFIPDEIWHIKISARSGQLKDGFNYAGVSAGATTGIDKYDYPEPPPIGEYISLYFVADSKNNLSYSSDFRPENKDGYIFDFAFSSNQNRESTIRLLPHNLPAHFHWIVVSPKTGMRYDKDVIHTKSQNIAFKLIVGTKDFIADYSEDYRQKPADFRLWQNYPNPFNPQTVAKYQLPQPGQVTIEVYNILGQRVKTLLRNKFKEAGYFQVKWNGTTDLDLEVSSGIYLLIIRTERFSKAIKMIRQN